MKIRNRVLPWLLSAGMVMCGSSCGKRTDTSSSSPVGTTVGTVSSETSATTTSETTAASRVGEVITFGTLDGEPVEWMVVDQNENGLLLLSKYLLDSKAYNEKYNGVTWETSTLRKWLNEEFFTELFNEEERNQVITTKLQVAGNPDYGTPGGNPTEDKLFLLSLDEVARYLPTPKDRACTPIKHAIDDKIWVCEEGTCYWWLISPGFDEYNACMIDTSGFIGRMGYRVHNRNLGIRPAFWLKTEA